MAMSFAARGDAGTRRAPGPTTRPKICYPSEGKGESAGSAPLGPWLSGLFSHMPHYTAVVRASRRGLFRGASPAAA
eukprot:6711617-Alexandrium_andersonii.AAC.1